MKGESPAVIPVVSNDPLGMASLPGSDTYEFFTQAKEKTAPSWENQVTVKR